MIFVISTVFYQSCLLCLEELKKRERENNTFYGHSSRCRFCYSTQVSYPVLREIWNPDPEGIVRKQHFSKNPGLDYRQQYANLSSLLVWNFRINLFLSTDVSFWKETSKTLRKSFIPFLCFFFLRFFLSFKSNNKNNK